MHGDGNESLAAQLAAITAAFSGRVGLYSENLTTGEVVEYEADTIFHSASTIKLAILIALYRRAAAGEVALDTVVPVQAANRVGGAGVLASLSADVRLTLYDLAVLMTIVSDNTATNECIDAVGVDYVNAMLDAYGLSDMRLFRKVRPPEARGDEPFGQASPRSLGRLMALLAAEQVAPPDACAEMLSILQRQQQNMLLTRYLPGWEEYPVAGAPVVASKSGRIRGTHHDVGIVWQDDTAYVIAVMSDGCQDGRYHPDNEALLQLPQLSAAVHRHWLESDRQRQAAAAEKRQAAAAEKQAAPGTVRGERAHDSWVVLQTFHVIYEADQLAALLQSAGWPALVRPARGGSMALTGVLPGHEVLVPAAVVDDVVAFLQAEPAD